MNTYLQAQYHLLDEKKNKYKLSIKIGIPQIDNNYPNKDFYSTVEIKGPNFYSERKIHGIDPLQVLWLSFYLIDAEVKKYEKENSLKCEYFFNEGKEFLEIRNLNIKN